MQDCMHDRVHLAFEVVGRERDYAGKSPIILLHALTFSKENWQDVILPIAEATRRKVYAFDARNHGDSGWSENFDTKTMTQDLLQFIDCIHCQKVILIGHSIGGMTAMNFALTWPERVEKLIVEDVSPLPVSKHVKDRNVKYMQQLHDSIKNIPSDVTHLQEAKNFVYEFSHGIKTQDDQRRQNTNKGSSLPLYQNESGQFKWKTNLKVLDKFVRKVHQHPSLTGLYPGPTLMLYGTLSPFEVPAHWDYIRHIFPEAQLRAIEGASHLIHEEHPDAFVKEVADFIMES